MPLPLPNLDTRTWTDMVEEARAIIPRNGREWTDHNLHDPGITIVELLAWLGEIAIYRANRITDQYRRKFLELLGYSPIQPRAARAIVQISPTGSNASSGQLIPRGTILEAGNGKSVMYFMTLDDLMVVSARIASVQVHDGQIIYDLTRVFTDGGEIQPFGPDAQVTDDTALYIGFDVSLPPEMQVSLWFEVSGHSATGEESKKLAESLSCSCQTTKTDCPPLKASPYCWDEESSVPKQDVAVEHRHTVPSHHSARTRWEYYSDEGGGRWQELSSAQIEDQTRCFTLSGAVRMKLLRRMKALQLGDSLEDRYYVRCRLVRGQYDETPALASITLNAILVEQSAPLWQQFKLAPSMDTSAIPADGAMDRLAKIDSDELDRVSLLSFDASAADAPLVRMLGRNTTRSNPSISLQIICLGESDGRPNQTFQLPQPRLLEQTLQLWTLEAGIWKAWRQQPDLDSSSRVDAHFAISGDAQVIFGDGERGRVPPLGAMAFMQAQGTLGEGGNGTFQSWRLANSGLENAVGVAVAPPAPNIRQVGDSRGGADAETVEAAAGRAATALWAHERLVEFADQYQSVTLDGIHPKDVLITALPQRASTLLDLERLALSAPGCRVHRARAWAEYDPAYPKAVAVGTVALIVLPALPRDAPMPSAGLLEALRRYLEPLRTLCTRLVITGPSYVVVECRLRVKCTAGTSQAQVRKRIIAALGNFLHPLSGGPDRTGWPFGRHVYRCEVMQVAQRVDGVEHIMSLELAIQGCEPSCADVCVNKTSLVRSGSHQVDFVEPNGQSHDGC